jgi:hypothetical protein
VSGREEGNEKGHRGPAEQLSREGERWLKQKV